MYKVKTIVLPDHYTLMDVAYIYTWKRETPMRFFYRVRSQNLAKIKVKTDVEHLDSSATVSSENIKCKDTKISLIKTEINDDSEFNFNENKKSDSKINNSKVKIEESESLDSKQTVKVNKDDKNEVRKYTKKVKKEKTDEKKPENIKLIIDLAKQKIKSEASSSNSSVCSSSSSSSNNGNGSGNGIIEKDSKLKIKVECTNLNLNKSKQAVSPKSPKSNLQGSLKNLTLSSSVNNKQKSPSSSDKKAKSPKKDLVTPPQSPRNINQEENDERTSENVNDEETKKYEFLNTFNLTPKKLISPTQNTTPEKEETKPDLAGLKLLAMAINSMSGTSTTDSSKTTIANSITSPNKLINEISTQPSIKITFSKRKLTDSSSKSLLKKSRMEKSENKGIVEYKIKNNNKSVSSPPSPPTSVPSLIQPTPNTLNSLSFDFAPYPIGSKHSTSPKSNQSSVSPKNKSPEEKQKIQEKLENKSNVVIVNNVARPNKTDTPRPIPKIPANKLEKSQRPIDTFIKPSAPAPIRKKLPTILPKKTPAQTPVDLINKMPGTEIKKINNDGRNPNLKVYGPSMEQNKDRRMSGLPNPPPPLTYPGPGGMKNSMSGGYLNFALMNASKNKIGGDTPTHIPLSRMSPNNYTMRSPRYAPNSPIYSPNSPSYTPNYNIPTQPQYKYVKSPVYAPNLLQNILPKQLTPIQPKIPTSPLVSSSTPNQPSKSTSPNNISIKTPNQLNKSLSPPNEKKDEQKHGNKRGATSSPSSSNDSIEPPEKQKKVQSLLNSCNISLPSSLSITLTNDKEEASSNSLFNKQNVNNYIEILKVKDTNNEEGRKSLSPSKHDVSNGKNENVGNKNGNDNIIYQSDKPIPNLNPVGKSLKPSSFQDSYLQAIQSQITTKPNKPHKLSQQQGSTGKQTKKSMKNDNSEITITQENPFQHLASQISELQQKALWEAASPQNLPTFLNNAVVQADSFLSRLYQRALLMRMQNSKEFENFYQQNLLNNLNNNIMNISNGNPLGTTTSTPSPATTATTETRNES